ncbi:MAG: 50S ribosomal protein L1 [bacterium]
MTTKNKSKRYQELEEKVQSGSYSDLKEAVQAVKKVATADFAETVECHVRLNIDPAQADQQFRASLVLPHGTGQETRVIVFARGEKVKEAEEAGVTAVGADDLIEKIQDGWLEFDQAVATPDMMSDVSVLGPVLGPRGLMPNNKAGTVTFDVADVVEKLKKGQMELRNDQYGIIHTIVGIDEMTADELRDNLQAVLKFIVEERPAGVKGQGQYLDSIVITPTMGPSVKIDPAAAWDLL